MHQDLILEEARLIDNLQRKSGAIGAAKIERFISLLRGDRFLNLLDIFEIPAQLFHNVLADKKFAIVCPLLKQARVTVERKTDNVTVTHMIRTDIESSEAIVFQIRQCFAQPMSARPVRFLKKKVLNQKRQKIFKESAYLYLLCHGRCLDRGSDRRRFSEKIGLIRE